MFKNLIKFFKIYLLIFLLCNVLVKCNVIETKSYDENREESSVSETESTENSSNDYDYNASNDEKNNNNDNDPESFLDKVKLIHEEGRTKSMTKNVKHINDTFEILSDMRKNFGSLFGINGRENLKIIEFLSDINLGLSPDCSAAFLKIFNGIKEKQIWALKFVDSMGHLQPHGFLDGILSDFGEYDECLNIESPMTEKNGMIIKGQYCMSRLILPFPAKNSYREGEPVNQELDFSSIYGNDSLASQLTVQSIIEALNVINGSLFRIGICIPSICRPYEVENMINMIMQPITRLPIEIDSKCHMKDEIIKLDNFQLISISIISILLILVISSTGLDLYKNYNNLVLPKSKITKLDEMFLSFSLIKNNQSLFAESNKRFAALDTLRLLLIIHVVVGHGYTLGLFYNVASAKNIVSWVMPRVFDDGRYFFVRAPLVIDSFFSLSGFLISYGLLRKLAQSKGRFNYFGFIFQQWVRFLVLVFASIMFFYLYPLTGEGPVWDYGVEYITSGCKNPSNLIKIFFFVNNYNDWQFDNFNTTCNTPLWFLSTLLQFLAIAPIFIIIYYKKPKFGIIAIIGAILLSLFISIAPQLIFGIKNYLQILVHGIKLLRLDASSSFSWFHTTPNNHAISFFVGIAFGFLMTKKIKISESKVKLFWFLTPVMITAVYYWHNSFWKKGDSEPVLSSLLWLTIGKLIYNLSFGWIYYACCSGRGGILNDMLSWRGFQPIARLSFGIYLLHYLAIFHNLFSIKEIQIVNDNILVEKIVINLIKDIALAYIFYILVESPFSNIFKSIFGGNRNVENIENNNNAVNVEDAQQRL